MSPVGSLQVPGELLRCICEPYTTVNHSQVRLLVLLSAHLCLCTFPTAFCSATDKHDKRKLLEWLVMKLKLEINGKPTGECLHSGVQTCMHSGHHTRAVTHRWTGKQQVSAVAKLIRATKIVLDDLCDKSQWLSIGARRYYQLSWPTTVLFITLRATTFLELSW